GKSFTLFGREYLALSDGKFGIDIPRQYDGTFFDRVSQVGPGAPPRIGDAPGPGVTIVASPAGLIPLTSAIATIKGFGDGQVLITCSADIPAGIQIGDKVSVTG